MAPSSTNGDDAIRTRRVRPSPALTPRPPIRTEPQDEQAAIHPRRAKRGRYTPVACKECKKKKLKCLPASSDGDRCARCISNDLPCVYLRRPSKASRTQDRGQNDQIATLSDEITVLRQDMSSLIQTVSALQSQQRKPQSPSGPSSHPSEASVLQLHHRRTSTTAQQVPLVQSPAASEDAGGGPSVQFIGPTRPAYAFHVGEGSLTRMGIPTYESLPPSHSLPPSRSSSPVDTTTPCQYWSRSVDTEIERLVQIWRDEVYAVYPCLDIDDSSWLRQSLTLLREQASGTNINTVDHAESQRLQSSTGSATALDADLVQVIVSSGMVLDYSGKNELAKSIVEAVRERFFRETYTKTVCLKRVQLLVILSIYYFHAGEELSSWRMIGLAARDALELGLHRRQSIFGNFKDEATRELAIRVFWCLYVLDRRWSFGTGLSFAIVDTDIDPEVPEPGPEHAYLKSMVGYGRLCSRIWAAIPRFDLSSNPIPDDLVDQLHLEMQEWHHSIPFFLQLRHPRLGMAPPSQPPELQRLRTMLYLRGNHVRCLLHRHYLLSSKTIAENLPRAWLVVNIAEDSIEVLTHLRATTEIYARQPHAFHYFLMSALAIVFLAVCHAPEIFTAPCRKRFMEAVELIKSFSQQSPAGRRLWKTIRTLLVRLKSIGLHDNGEGNVATSEQPSREAPSADTGAMSNGRSRAPSQQIQDPNAGSRGMMFAPNNALDAAGPAGMLGSFPDLSPQDIGADQDLMSVFDALGQGHLYPQPPDDVNNMGGYSSEFGFVTDMGGDILRQFQGFV